MFWSGTPQCFQQISWVTHSKQKDLLQPAVVTIWLACDWMIQWTNLIFFYITSKSLELIIMKPLLMFTLWKLEREWQQLLSASTSWHNTFGSSGMSIMHFHKQAVSVWGGLLQLFSLEHFSLITKLVIIHRWTYPWQYNQSFPHALLFACGLHSVRDSSLVCPYGLFIRWRRRLVLSLQRDFNRELDHPLINAILSHGRARRLLLINGGFLQNLLEFLPSFPTLFMKNWALIQLA